jgi:hypothetical protein
MLSKSVREKIGRLESRITEFHREVDRLINERVCDVAETISGVPTDCLRDILVNRASGGFCRCQAIKNLAAGDDGL